MTEGGGTLPRDVNGSGAKTIDTTIENRVEISTQEGGDGRVNSGRHQQRNYHVQDCGWGHRHKRHERYYYNRRTHIGENDRQYQSMSQPEEEDDETEQCTRRPTRAWGDNSGKTRGSEPRLTLFRRDAMALLQANNLRDIRKRAQPLNQNSTLICVTKPIGVNP